MDESIYSVLISLVVICKTQADKHIRQTYRQTDRQIDGRTYGQTDAGAATYQTKSPRQTCSRVAQVGHTVAHHGATSLPATETITRTATAERWH